MKVFIEKTIGFSIERKSRPMASASSLSRKTKMEISPKAAVSTVLSAFFHTEEGKQLKRMKGQQKMKR